MAKWRVFDNLTVNGNGRRKLPLASMRTFTEESEVGGCGMNPLGILDRMVVAVLAASVFAAGCGGGSGSSSSGPGTPPGPLTVSLSTSTVVAAQDGTPGTVDVTVSGANTGSSVSVAASNLPSGVTSQFAPAAGGLSGTLSLVAGSTTPAGTYSASVAPR